MLHRCTLRIAASVSKFHWLCIFDIIVRILVATVNRFLFKHCRQHHTLTYHGLFMTGEG